MLKGRWSWPPSPPCLWRARENGGPVRTPVPAMKSHASGECRLWSGPSLLLTALPLQGARGRASRIRGCSQSSGCRYESAGLPAFGQMAHQPRLEARANRAAGSVEQLQGLECALGGCVRVILCEWVVFKYSPGWLRGSCVVPLSRTAWIPPDKSKPAYRGTVLTMPAEESRKHQKTSPWAYLHMACL